LNLPTDRENRRSMSSNRDLTFGPVPSRRLGKSLGINNIPPKHCTYSCAYCQLGRTKDMTMERKDFYGPQMLFQSTEQRVRAAREKGESVDYLAFVPDGEPTLDIDLGKEIEALGTLGIKIAVISNSSLIWMEDVQKDLHKADWVSLKVDAVSVDAWQKINRPHGKLDLDMIMKGIIEFADSYQGKLVTETMLVKGINDENDEIEMIADFISGLDIAKSYLSIPIRPPAENWCYAASEDSINLAFQKFTEKGMKTECLVGYEGNAFASTGSLEEDILSITSVHPMRKDAVEELVKKAGQGWGVIEKLLGSGKLVELEHNNCNFYLRKFEPASQDGITTHKEE